MGSVLMKSKVKNEILANYNGGKAFEIPMRGNWRFPSDTSAIGIYTLKISPHRNGVHSSRVTWYPNAGKFISSFYVTINGKKMVMTLTGVKKYFFKPKLAEQPSSFYPSQDT